MAQVQGRRRIVNVFTVYVPMVTDVGLASPVNPDLDFEGSFATSRGFGGAANPTLQEVWGLSGSNPTAADGHLTLVYRYDANTMASNGVITSANPDGAFVGSSVIPIYGEASSPFQYDAVNDALWSVGAAGYGGTNHLKIMKFGATSATLERVVDFPFTANFAQTDLISLSNGTLFAVNNNQTIYQIDPTSFATIGSWTLGYGPGYQVYREGPDGNIWFTAGGITNLFKFDVTTHVVTLPYTNANGIATLFMNTVENTVWVRQNSDNSLIELNSSGVATGRAFAAPTGFWNMSNWYDPINNVFWGSMDNTSSGYRAINMDGSTWGLIDYTTTSKLSQGNLSSGFTGPQPGMPNAVYIDNAPWDNALEQSDTQIVKVPVSARHQ